MKKRGRARENHPCQADQHPHLEEDFSLVPAAAVAPSPLLQRRRRRHRGVHLGHGTALSPGSWDLALHSISGSPLCLLWYERESVNLDFGVRNWWLKVDAKNLVVRSWLRWSEVKNGGQRLRHLWEARSLMHQDNGVPSQQHRPTEETAKLENTITASNGKSSSAQTAPSSNQSSTAQSALASQTTSGSVSRDKRSLEVSRRRRQSSAKSTTSSSSSSVGKLDSSKDANQSAVGIFYIKKNVKPLYDTM